MGMKPRTKKPPEPTNSLLLVRPRGVGPDWWPRVDPAEADFAPATYAWATVTDGGGWTLGIDPLHAVGASSIQDMIEAWYEDHEQPGWPWEFCLLERSNEGGATP